MTGEHKLLLAKKAAALFLGQPAQAVTCLGRGTANQSFLVCGQTGDKYVLRRRSAKYAQLDFAGFEAEYLAHLARSGLPVPELLTRPDGGFFLELDGTSWQMSHYIKGQPFTGSPGQIWAAGTCLASLHEAASGFRPAKERLYGRHEHPLDLKERYRQISRSLYLDKDEQALSSWIELLLARLSHRISDEVYARLPQLHIHGDFHSFNLLFTADQVSGIFDFDQASWQARLRDLADGIIFFGSVRQQPIADSDIIALTQDFLPRPELYQIFLQAYQTRAAPHMSELEVSLLPDFIAARFLGMRFDGLAKLPQAKRRYMLEEDYTSLLGWLDGGRISLP